MYNVYAEFDQAKKIHSEHEIHSSKSKLFEKLYSTRDLDKRLDKIVGVSDYDIVQARLYVPISQLKHINLEDNSSNYTKLKFRSLGIILCQKDKVHSRDSGIYISSIIEKSIASQCEDIHAGDRLIAVNDVLLDTKTEDIIAQENRLAQPPTLRRIASVLLKHPPKGNLTSALDSICDSKLAPEDDPFNCGSPTLSDSSFESDEVISLISLPPVTESSFNDFSTMDSVTNKRKNRRAEMIEIRLTLGRHPDDNSISTVQVTHNMDRIPENGSRSSNISHASYPSLDSSYKYSPGSQYTYTQVDAMPFAQCIELQASNPIKNIGVRIKAITETKVCAW
ncbi:hypothetical protein Ciccas_003552 [Cichlidogyrus casuarinus]|uniref:PDZ domain-containing protein n=1 Tax=Cichlidogyrus casuarinus TaxID=1844966 RepID=A0ABD2QE26_9PLAT